MTAPVACRTPLSTALRVELGASMVSRLSRRVTVGFTGGWFISVGGSWGTASAGEGNDPAGPPGSGLAWGCEDTFFFAAEPFFFGFGTEFSGGFVPAGCATCGRT